METVLPDGSSLETLLDSAHRYGGVADTVDNQDDLTLDALGDAVDHTIFTGSGNLVFWRTATFDGLGRKLADTSTVTGKSTTFTYDNNGNPLTVTDPLGHKTTNVFDALDRLTKSTDANNGVMQKTYDTHNRPLTVTDKDGHVTTYVYDGFGDVISQASPDSGTTVYHYDSDGNLTSKTDAAGVVTNLTYDALDRVKTVAYPADAAENVAYTYDQSGHGFGVGRLTSLTDAAGSHGQTFGYDLLNRLTGAVSAGTYGTLAWTYDANGNLATRTAGGVAYTYGYTAGTNRLATVTSTGNSQTSAYTPTGNLSSLTLNGATSYAMTYNKANRLSAISGTGVTPSITAMTYDAFGHRITKTDSGSTPIVYTYDQQGHLLEESKAGVAVDYIYLDGVNVAEWVPAEKHLYMVNYDTRGVPQVSRDEYGLTNWAAYSTPYGALTTTQTKGEFTGPVTQNLRLPGQYFDQESGLHQNGARDLLPAWGRFPEVDPIGLGGGLNPYAYAAGNPLKYKDRSRRFSAAEATAIMETANALWELYQLQQLIKNTLPPVPSTRPRLRGDKLRRVSSAPRLRRKRSGCQLSLA